VQHLKAMLQRSGEKEWNGREDDKKRQRLKFFNPQIGGEQIGEDSIEIASCLTRYTLSLEKFSGARLSSLSLSLSLSQFLLLTLVFQPRSTA
jgi:hypothetical protein